MRKEEEEIACDLELERCARIFSLFPRLFWVVIASAREKEWADTQGFPWTRFPEARISPIWKKSERERRRERNFAFCFHHVGGPQGWCVCGTLAVFLADLPPIPSLI